MAIVISWIGYFMLIITMMQMLLFCILKQPIASFSLRATFFCQKRITHGVQQNKSLYHNFSLNQKHNKQDFMPDAYPCILHPQTIYS